MRTSAVESTTTEAMRKAASAIAQQEALIGELQSARQKAVKAAAALVEATKLAQEERIDVADIFDVANRLITDGTVKLSSYDEAFDQSPGEIQEPAAAEDRAAPDASTRSDVLTATLRSMR
jgi:hypothetical protein